MHASRKQPRRPPAAVALLIAMILHIGFCPLAFAQLNVERVFPPAVTLGEETLLTAEGKFPSWPAQLWCDRDDVSCRIEKDSGRVAVTVAAGAPPGIAWLRFFDDDSASALVPLLIESVAVTAEVEPNNEIAQATPTDLPAVLVGRLEKANDVDCFVVSVSKGQTLVADVMANRILGSPMDAVLQLVDLSGNVLAQSDDVHGLDPQLVYPCDQDAEYLLRLFAFPEVATSTIGFAGAASFVYRIHATTGPLVDHSLPLVAAANAELPSAEVPVALFGWNLPADASAVIAPATTVSPPIVTLPGALGWYARHRSDVFSSDPAIFTVSADAEITDVQNLPAILSGHITRPGRVVRVRASVAAGTKYRAVVHAQASGLGLDSVVNVVDPETGKPLGRNDDAAPTNRDSVVDFTAPGDQAVEIQISDLVGGFGLRHAFSVSIGKIEPAVSLGLAADRYSLKPGKPLEIPIKIQRRDGFDERLRIVALDLPGGVTSESVYSEAKGDSAKEVKIKLSLSADRAERHQGPIRIVAHRASASDTATEQAPAAGKGPDEAAADEPEEVISVATFPLRDGFSLRELWLSVSP